MKIGVLIFSTILLFGCAVKVPVSSSPNNTEANTAGKTEIKNKGWTVIGPQIQGAKLKEDFELFLIDDQAYMIPSSGCIVNYDFDKANNELNKNEVCESLIYEITEEGLVKLPELPLDEKPTSLTKWNGKLLMAAQKSESGNGNKPITHIIIYELDTTGNSWKIFAPYGFTKEFYTKKNGNGLTHAELGGITDGPLYLIYGDPYLKMIKYEHGLWKLAHSEKASQGGIAGQRGQVFNNKFYYSFQDYGHDNIGPHIKQVDSTGNLTDLGGFPFATATNSNIAFSGDGKNYILLSAKARLEGDKFGKYELRALKNGKWESITSTGLPDNLSHYWTCTHKGEYYISARIAPPTGSVYQAKASVYKFNGTIWVPVGNTNFTTVMPNYPKVFPMKGKLYCIYNQEDGGYTLMQLIGH